LKLKKDKMYSPQ